MSHYSIGATNDDLAPRVMTGEQMVFDTDKPVEVDQLVAAYMGAELSPQLRLIGYVRKLTPKSLFLALTLDDKTCVRFSRNADLHVHVCVGVMTPMVTPDERARATMYAAARREFKQGVDRLPPAALTVLLDRMRFMAEHRSDYGDIYEPANRARLDADLDRLFPLPAAEHAA